MEVILLSNMLHSGRHSGKIGDRINVRNGFANNYLIPKKLALCSNVKNLKDVSSMLKSLHENLEGSRYALEQSFSKAAAVCLYFSPKGIGKDGALFGSLTKNAVYSVLCDKVGNAIDKKHLVMPSTIRSTGVFKIDLHAAGFFEDKINSDLKSEFHIVIAKSEEESAEMWSSFCAKKNNIDDVQDSDDEREEDDDDV